MSLYPGFNKEKETSFLTLCMAKFGWTATSLFEIWTTAWSSDITCLFFSFFYRMVLFLSSLGFFFLFSFFFFFYQGIFFTLGFSVSEDFSTSKELLRVIILSARCKQDMELHVNENRASTWAVAAKLPQGICLGPRLWHLPNLLTFIWKYVF